jgi:hypothetical protein
VRGGKAAVVVMGVVTVERRDLLVGGYDLPLQKKNLLNFDIIAINKYLFIS